MPKLRRRIEDGGYYFVTSVPAWITYQVTERGVRLLEERGIREGSEIPRSLVSELIRQGSIRTGGTGPGSGSEPAPGERCGIPEDLIACLIEWAISGDEDSLDQLLSTSPELNYTTCFPRSYPTWLEDTLNASLSSYLDISLSDFRTLLERYRPTAQLHQALNQSDQGDIVLWRFARLIGEVATYAEADQACPHSWQGHVRGWLFEDIHGLMGGERRSGGQRKRRVTQQSPYLFWDTYGQSVMAVLSLRGITQGTKVRLRIRPSPSDEKPEWQTIGHDHPGEIRSEPLDPTEGWQVVAEYSSGGRSTYTIRPPSQDVILFSREGKMLTDAQQPPGEYLVLTVDPEQVEDQVSILEELSEPIGWEDYTAFRVAVSDGGRLSPYSFGSGRTQISWKLEQAPSTIEFAHAIPVWVGRWPRVSIQRLPGLDISALLLEAQVFTGSEILPRRRSVWLDPEQNIGVHITAESVSVNLEHIGLNCWGRVRLMLHSLSGGGDWQLPEPIEFIQLPELRLRYAPDPRFSRWAYCLRLMDWSGRLEACEGTEILEGSQQEAGTQAWLIRATNPFASPEVWFTLEGLSVRVGLPVTRVALVEGKRTLGQYQSPLIEISLADITLDMYLRLMLHRPPHLVDDQLHCRLIGGLTLEVGRRRGSNLFDIPLHRWRDAFGVDQSGVVEVEYDGGWMPIARLVRRPSTVPGPLSYDEQLINSLLTADTIRTFEGLSDICLQRALEEICSVESQRELVGGVAEASLLWGDVTRAVQLCRQHGELIGAEKRRLIEMKARLRQITDRYELNRFANEVALESTLRTRLEGELNYRLARVGGSRQTLEAAQRLLARLSPLSFVDQFEIALLSAMLNLHTEGQLPRELAQTCEAVGLGVLPWIADYLNTALGDWKATECPFGLAPMIAHLLASADHMYLKLCIAQASGNQKQSRQHLNAILGTGLIYGKLELLAARQFLLEGKEQRAMEQYFELVGKEPLAISEVTLLLAGRP